MASSTCLASENVTKPNPLDLPVSRSYITVAKNKEKKDLCYTTTKMERTHEKSDTDHIILAIYTDNCLTQLGQQVG